MDEIPLSWLFGTLIVLLLVSAGDSCGAECVSSRSEEECDDDCDDNAFFVCVEHMMNE